MVLLVQEGDFCLQVYYIRPRFGDFFWDVVKATKLRVMLEAAIQRRFPKGLKVRGGSNNSSSCC